MRIRADGPVVEWGSGDVWEGLGGVKVMRRIATARQDWNRASKQASGPQPRAQARGPPGGINA